MPTINGTYTVIVTAPVGCTAVSASFILTNAGIKENVSPVSELSIIPNPAYQNVSVQLSLKKSTEVRISIFDSWGINIYSLDETHPCRRDPGK